MIRAASYFSAPTLVIAIDGPAASGKGTVGRRLAANRGYHYLDTGKLYRAVARDLLRAGKTPDDEAASVAAALAIDARKLEDEELQSSLIGQAASIVSAIPAVREALLQFQREYAKRKPGAVLDGRDIGTIVCPDARVKLFVTADIEARARRRHLELLKRGEAITYEETLDDLAKRDARDQSRPIAPLRPANDAHLLDTTKLSIDAAVEMADAVIKRVTDR